MKKLNLLLFAFFSIYAFSGVNTVLGFSIIKPAANNEVPASSSAIKYLKASEFVKLSVKEFSDLTGKKLNLFERMSFKITKMKMKHDLKKNPDLKLTDYINGEGTTFKIDALWLILGVLIGPIGVLLAYVTKQESYKITSSWIGFAVWLILGGVLFVF